MARRQCIFLGDEIAAGVYNFVNSNYRYSISTQYVKVSDDRYDTPHFCWDFNRWRWNNDDDIRYAPWYVISTGLHDYDKDYYQDMYEIRRTISRAREGFGLAPRVIWIAPGSGTQNQNKIIRTNIQRVISTFGGRDLLLDDLYQWSQNWVPAAFYPSAPTNILAVYKALGYTTFPRSNPFSGINLPSVPNWSLATIATNISCQTYLTYRVGTTAKNTIVAIAKAMTTAGLGSVYTVATLNSLFVTQINVAAMNISGVNTTYPAYQQRFSTRTYINDNRIYPTTAGYQFLANRILQMSSYFTA